MINARLASPSPRKVAWTWLDIVVVIAVMFLGAAILAVVAVAVLDQIDGALPHAARVALASGTAELILEVLPIVSIIVIVRLRKSPLSSLGWTIPRDSTGRSLLPRWGFLALPIAVATVVIAWVLLIASGVILHLLVPQQDISNGQCTAIRDNFGPYLLLILPLTCIVAPVCEETLFRGFIYGKLRSSLPLWAAIVVIALFFGFVHLEILLFLPLVGVGAILALTYEYSGSLIPGAIVHGLFNLWGMIQFMTSSGC